MTEIALETSPNLLLKKLYDNINKVICGKAKTVDTLIMALLAGGHVLLEDVPGLGKTLLAKVIARSINAQFRRIQCTPDMLPSDITGVSIFNYEDKKFKFIPGPIFTNVLLVDEINRASPRTQSCMLEAMGERQVTIEGNTYKLQMPFFTIATQNPVEYHGTFELPEAQLDRFMVVLNLGYPTDREEINILDHCLCDKSYDVEPVISIDDYITLYKHVKSIHVAESIKQYIVDIVTATRNKKEIRLGVSPRGSLNLLNMAQASAAISNRTYVLPDDIKRVAVDVLSHRVIPIQRRDHLSNSVLIRNIVQEVKPPQ